MEYLDHGWVSEYVFHRLCDLCLYSEDINHEILVAGRNLEQGDYRGVLERFSHD